MISAIHMPLTNSQKLIWMGQSLAPDVPLYNMAWRFDLHLPLDEAAFAQAFQDVIRKHDALCVSFSSNGRDVIQTSAELGPFPPSLDFSDEPDPSPTVQKWCEARATRAIDLGRNTYDTCLIKLGPDHWVWFFNQHHIATDAWSGSLIFKAVSAAYSNIMAGGNMREIQPPKFADYATTVAAISPETAQYWADKSKARTANTIPYGGTNDPTISASTRIKIDFGRARSEALKSLATSPSFRSISPDLSIFALLMTGYAAFLSRVTNQSSVVVGTPSHNRATPDLKMTAGLFIEMFPLVLDISPENTFRDLFKSTLAETMGFLRHAKPGASSATTASAFNAVLNYIPVSYGNFAGAETQIQWLHPNAHDANNNLRLHVYDFEGSGTLTMELDCNDAAISPAQRNRIPAHLLTIFDSLLHSADQSISALPLLSAASHEADLACQTGPSKSSPHTTILEAFADTLAENPDSIACECNGESLTYAALNTRADGFAAHLKSQGIAEGDPVLIHAKRSNNLVGAILGILKVGAFFIPVPSDAPKGRLDAISSLANPKLTLTDSDLIALPSGATQNLPQIASDLPAYAIFTSGSTGEPKGVQVDHGDLLEYIRWASETFGPSGPKSYPLYSSIGFDLTLTSLFVPLLTGGRIVIYADSGNPTDLSVLDVFAQDQVDVVKLTPAHLSLLCEKGARTKRIKTLVLGGENLSTKLCMRALQTINSDITILNEYGPTEAVVGSMFHRFDPAKDTKASVPIGRPADNTRIAILDAGLNPVPIGVSGEIHISGRLANGYLNRPDLTAETFITATDGQRLYKTGDLARTTEDGTIEYLGREDAQLKINGVRIEPVEIEAAFYSLPYVTQAYVTTHQRMRPPRANVVKACRRCGISSDVPDITIGADAICQICAGFDAYKSRAEVYFKKPEDLATVVSTLPSRKTGKYDAIVLLSGGKDSTYALYRFAELTGNILALTLDNGFISEGAKTNIRRVTDDLGIDHRFMRTPAMNAIFKESLTKHSNVCQGCFKTIYTLALETARNEGIPAIVTGLSRGQFFETRLTPELFENRAPSAEEIDSFVKDARLAYHGIDDAVSRNLNINVDAETLNEIEIIDVYRYLDVPVSEIYTYLHARGAWSRPDDTGRSTNCLINDVGIYVHKKREGFHNYALPYSWDVRMGHKTRAEAVDELDDEIDTSRVTDILTEIGFDQTLLSDAFQTQLVVYVSGENLDDASLRNQIAQKLLPSMIPAHIIVLDALPLTSNGKIDTAALPQPESHRISALWRNVPASNDTERQLFQVYMDILGNQSISVTDNFYDLGGDSIAAIQISILASDRGLAMEPNAVFQHQTIRDLAEHLDAVPYEEQAKPDDESLWDEPLLDLDATDLDAITKQLSGST